AATCRWAIRVLRLVDQPLDDVAPLVVVPVPRAIRPRSVVLVIPEVDVVDVPECLPPEVRQSTRPTEGEGLAALPACPGQHVEVTFRQEEAAERDDPRDVEVIDPHE